MNSGGKVSTSLANIAIVTFCQHLNLYTILEAKLIGIFVRKQFSRFESIEGDR